MLLAGSETITFGEAISDPLIICTIIFAAIGIACVLLAKKVTVVVRKTKDVTPNDKVFVGMRVAGLVLILLGFVFMLIWGAIGIAG